MQENNLKEKTIKRPWQANVLIFIETFFISALLISLFLGFIFTECFIFINDFFINFYNFRWDILVLIIHYPIFSVGAVFSDSDNLIILVALPFFIFDIYLLRGFLKGWKWSIIVKIIYSFLIIVCLVFIELGTIRAFILTFMLHFLTLLLCFSCLKHPFYNQKKEK